jgi:epoxyqueuosine reductase
MSSQETNQSVRTGEIKKLFLNEGFQKIGICAIEDIPEEKSYFKKWLDDKKNAGMEWLNTSFDKRTNPKLIDNDFVTVLAAAFIYDTPYEHSENPDIAKISRYAWGNSDYHKVLKKKLKKICREIESIADGIKTKYYVDDGPVMEKVWAKKSGIGWMGKHTNIINPEFGSYFFLSEVFINIKLDYDKPIEDLCETCSICLNACPTGAIYEPYKLDANLCISYHTIENRNEIPEYIDLNGWIFGCDICQEVCPYNKHKFFTNDEDNFKPLEKVFNKSFDELNEITEEKSNELFKLSPIKRTKFPGWVRNINKCRM